jgi:predicted RNase H-like HicB family nuclease
MATRKKSHQEPARTGILTDYLAAAMRRATYQILDDGTYWGEIQGIDGVWADENTLEECRDELQSVLESWIVVCLEDRLSIPPIDGAEISSGETS